MKKLLFIGVIVAACTSCGASMKEKVRLAGKPEWRVESLSRVVVSVDVENSSRRTLKACDGRFTIDTPSGKTIATVLLTDTLVVPRRATTHLDIPLRVKLHDLSALMSMPDDLTVSGTATVRSGPVRKKIGIQKKSISEFLK